MQKLDFLPMPHRVLEGPIDVGIEQRWRVHLRDAKGAGDRPAMVGQLAPDLARDASIRRRYLRDLERVQALRVDTIVPNLAIGPVDAQDVGDSPPWRVRLDPEGTPLSQWLARAPVPLEEFSAVFADVADAVHAVHRAGAVLRDLAPEQILRRSDGRFVLVDVGLARVDVLSSHTASSLLLRGSTHAAPEQLLKTAVDQRADVYSLGIMMWQALTDTMPFGDGPAFMAERHALPSLSSMRSDVPAVLDALVARCLREAPEERPASASEIAWVLRGGGTANMLADPDATTCQHCSNRLRIGQRLCLACGRVAVRFAHAPAGTPGWGLDLLSLSEDAAPLRWLQDFIASVARPPVRAPEFVIGSVHMYSEDERAERIRLPTRLFSNLEAETAVSLHELLQRQGLRTRLVSPRAPKRAGALVASAFGITIFGALLLSAFGASPWWVIGPGVIACIVMLANLMNKMSEQRAPPRYLLRASPAALPASDPLVSRLSELLQGDPPADVRPVVEELALLVQRLVDHRASLMNTHELEVLTAPVEPIVDAVEHHARQLQTLDRELEALDEGAMVRAFAASEARGEPTASRDPILEGLDRLRALEDRRANVFHRLLEAKTLLTRTVELGLAVRDPARQHERDIQAALATLSMSSEVEAGPPTPP